MIEVKWCLYTVETRVVIDTLGIQERTLLDQRHGVVKLELKQAACSRSIERSAFDA